MSEFPCPHCQASLRLAALLSAVTGYDRATQSASSPCPACGRTLEFRVRRGLLTLGYTYWAGAMHFEGMVEVSAPGLRLIGEDGSERLELDGVRYELPGGGSQG